MGLDRVRALLAELGDPQTGVRGALIAGTNGKGSTSAFLESILRAGGLHTGMMPKPHLSSYTERIQIDARPLPESEFAAAVAAVQPAVERVAEDLGPPTEFEMLTAVALAHIAPRVERLVCEVGMGGRLDATNVLDLGVAVVTNVALDHMRYLGDTVEAIAGEKAAIVKPGNHVITGAAPPALAVVAEQAAAAGATLLRLGQEITYEATWAGWDGSELTVTVDGAVHSDLHVPLLGSYQPANAALAVAAAEALGDATPTSVRAGLASTRWPGRLEVFEGAPRIVLDGAHNPAALDRVVPDLRRLVGREPVAVVFAAMADKDVAAMLQRLRGLDPAAIVFTRAASAGDRAAPPADLAAGWGPGAVVVEDAPAAVDRAREAIPARGTVLVCGSLYLVGDVRERLAAPTAR